MTDKRILKTRAAVKQALLEILESKHLSDVSVSELSAAAGISRSTFYCNYQNVQEVFEALISDFLDETRGLRTQLRCKGCQDNALDNKTPFCVAVRKAGRYQNVVRETGFLPALLNIINSGVRGTYAQAPYLERGLSPHVAENLVSFQMAGCYTAALAGGDDKSWEATQAAIDIFIAGGLGAIREMKSE